MKRVFLVGYMGSGKSSVGRLLSQSLGLLFIDMDLYIEQRYQVTLSQLFEQYGEAGFREIEMKMLRELGDFEDVLISTGGGAPCFCNNMEYMNERGLTVYLRLSSEVLLQRLKKGKAKRPLIAAKSDDELPEFINGSLASRESYYLRSSLVVDLSDSPSKDDSARLICDAITAHYEK